MVNEWTAVAASKQLCFLKPYISAKGIFDARSQPNEQQSSWIKNQLSQSDLAPCARET